MGAARMSIQLFEHNQKTYGTAVEMLAKTSNAAIIYPAGTSKSFIDLKYCEDNPDKKVCLYKAYEYKR